MKIVSREPAHVTGPSVRAAVEQLPDRVPALWREVFTAHVGPDDTFAELSEEPGGAEHVITVGVLSATAGATSVPVPAGEWLHEEHRGPVTGIWRTYARMYEYAAGAGLQVGTLKLDVGYRRAGDEATHDLFVQLLG